MVTLLLETPPAVHRLGEAEAQAIEVFAMAGFDVTVLDPAHDATHDDATHRRANRRTSAA
jgi:2-keto-3-deoxy-L-rhamnonate aldolase RhmA